jgi:glycosyltransferase involved in cell wall biosynthesis
MVERGWGVTIAYWHHDPPHAAGSRLIRLPAHGRARGWPAALRRLIRREAPDVVHVHGTAAGSIGAAVAYAAGARAIVHSEESLHAASPRDVRLARRLAARIPRVNVVPSRAVGRSLVRDAGAPRARVLLIHRGTPDAEPLPPPSNPPALVCVANLWPWKGQAVLLEAMRRLPSDVRLSLVGAGPERDRLRERITDLGLGDRVDLLGYRSDPWATVPGAWAAVHPSFHEAMPFSVLEAMMRGLPVVATAVGGTPEAVADGETGFLVPPGDPSALAGALGRLVADPGLRRRMSVAGRETALREFRFDAMVDAYLRLYERVLHA